MYVQEALTPELDKRCENPECAAVVPQPWKRRVKRFCSQQCTKRARHLAEVERCKGLTEKECRQCGEVKPIERYRHSWMLNCQDCMKKRRQRQYAMQGGKEYTYAQFLDRRYGLTVDAYRAISDAHNGHCAICGDKPSSRLHIDHDHKTGAVRGLLCRGCNHALGNALDDPSRLRAMADYLERHASAATT
jgi:hypothetical protein